MDSTTLRTALDALLRPMADGVLALVGGAGAPVVLGSPHERILAVCRRPTERAELVDVLVELAETDDPATGAVDAARVDAAIDELCSAGLLEPVGRPASERRPA